MLVRSAKLAFTAVAILGLLVMPQAAQAASPDAHISIAGPSHGFVFKSEHATAHNTWVARFQSSDSYVDVVGNAGTTVSFDDGVASNGDHYIGVGLGGGSVDKKNPPKSVGSVYDSLKDLGISAGKAQAYADSVNASSARTSPDTVSPMAASGQHYNFLNKCLNISEMGGAFTGYGCGSGFREWQDPANNSHWAISATYKTTIQGNHVTEKGVGAEITWPTGNMITDWNPYTTDTLSTNCVVRTFTVEMKLKVAKAVDLGFSESTQNTDCPDTVGPWNVNSRNSGAKWYSATGVQNQGMGVNGIQSVDSPATASAAFLYYYLIWY